jgi:hypothetical protein
MNVERAIPLRLWRECHSHFAWLLAEPGAVRDANEGGALGSGRVEPRDSWIAEADAPIAARSDSPLRLRLLEINPEIANQSTSSQLNLSSSGPTETGVSVDPRGLQAISRTMRAACLRVRYTRRR